MDPFYDGSDYANGTNANDPDFTGYPEESFCVATNQGPGEKVKKKRASRIGKKLTAPDTAAKRTQGEQKMVDNMIWQEKEVQLLQSE